jgi:gamma-glutamyl-gamma-aminobutyrate hydrolase PuuD
LFKTIYSALYRDDCHPFNVLAKDIDVVKDPDELKEANSALVVWGGSDINPEYYKHPMHSTTHPGGARDRLEWALMNAAKDKGIPIIGVCRGAQMLCALAGGWLIQNVRGHAGRGHWVKTFDNDHFFVNSLHHQMLAGLEEVEHELVGWSSQNHSDTYGYKKDELWVPPEGFKEPEFVYFPKVNGYAIQWHPEMMQSNVPATQYILKYIEKKEKERGYQFASITLPICEC